MGSIHVRPVSERIQRRVAAHLQEFEEHADGTAFFQAGGAAEEFLDDRTPAQRRWISSGWTLTFRVDAWEFGHWVGYDAHALFE